MGMDLLTSSLQLTLKFNFIIKLTPFFRYLQFYLNSYNVRGKYCIVLVAFCKIIAHMVSLTWPYYGHFNAKHGVHLLPYLYIGYIMAILRPNFGVLLLLF